ncbi:MAG TPA: ComEC/Rec2 family competence protein [Methanoregulaceae archaeon]|nr:ComEC/Rec2 family competence protein [Methanoregulaceae archaeon]
MDPALKYTILAVLIITLLCAGTGCTIRQIDLEGTIPAIPPYYAQNSGNLKVYFIDVGQGDAELLTCENFTMLIDAGDPDAGTRVVSTLKNLGITDIDILVATHPHADHIGGMQDVLKNFRVHRVIDTGMPHTTGTYQKFLETIDRQKIPYNNVNVGDVISPVQGLSFLVLNAPAGTGISPGDEDLNDASIVLRVSYGQINMLFEGDAGTAVEDRMIASGFPLESQVLKVAHHGSSHGTGGAFLARVRPEVAVISVGAGNPYGHPAAATLDRLTSAGAIIFRTDQDGTIVIRSDGMKYSVTTAKGGLYGVSPTPALTSTASA